MKPFLLDRLGIAQTIVVGKKVLDGPVKHEKMTFALLQRKMKADSFT